MNVRLGVVIVVFDGVFLSVSLPSVHNSFVEDAKSVASRQSVAIAAGRGGVGGEGVECTALEHVALFLHPLASFC